MDRFWKYLLLLAWLCYILLSGVSIFLQGFLLNRDVLTLQSTCKQSSVQTEPLSNRPKENDSFIVVQKLDFHLQTCAPLRSRVVLLIIDALMYDFTQYNESLGESCAPHQNKLPIINELLKTKYSQSTLFKFIADPPTTTMQRLKGLTTGSLPTFIDVGSNFASTEINEDNFLDQLRSQNRSAIFMGDDTWTSLYPNRFIREFSYPSFNVWDLDTVDRGVQQHLYPELKNTDWDLLIAHFLGVDHCGHRYGPNHPEMTRKLTEMDKVIRNTVKTIANDTTLIVIGDHGMTASGNHGGDSEAEITAAMFVYSSSPLMNKKFGNDDNSVNQVDLVPTLATLLGIPVPYSNLGSVILEALPIDDWESSLSAVVNNINQVNTYITTYSKGTHQFSEADLTNLKDNHKRIIQLANKVDSFDKFKEVVKESRQYLVYVKIMCEKVWVQFDIFFMSLGLFFVSLTVIFTFVIIQTIPSQKVVETLNGKIVYITAMLTILSSILSWLLLGSIFMVTCTTSLIFIIILLLSNIKDMTSTIKAQSKHYDLLGFFTVLIVMGSLFSMFSNSYVVEESTVVSFWLFTLVCMIFSNWKKEGNRSYKVQWIGLNLPSSSEKYIIFILVVAFGIAIRMFSLFWQCREEQNWCQRTSNSVPPNTKLKGPFTEVKFLPPLVLALPVLAVWVWLRECGNLVALSVTVTLLRIVPIFVSMCTAAFWVLEALPKKLLAKTVPWNIQLIPQVIFLLLALTVLWLLIQPLCIYVVPPRTPLELQVREQKNIVPHLFHHMKKVLSEDKSKDKNVSAVYGLPTVFSSTLLEYSLLILQFLALLHGINFAPALVIMYFSSFLLLGILAVYRIHKAVLTPQLMYVPWYSIVAWGLLSISCFYGTGNEATFPGIRWQAAFVGTDGEFSSNVWPALMVTASTFSAQLWLGLSLPLLLLCPFTLLTMFPRLYAKQDIRRGAANGELMMYENSIMASHSCFTLCIKYILFYALRVCASMVTAMLHRRHLMVWKVFAPKLIFEVAGMTVSMVAVLFSYLLVARVSAKLEALMSRLQSDQEEE